MLASEEKTYAIIRDREYGTPIKTVTTFDCSLKLDERKLFDNDTEYYLALGSSNFTSTAVSFVPTLDIVQLNVTMSQVLRGQYAYPTYYDIITVMYNGNVTNAKHF